MDFGLADDERPLRDPFWYLPEPGEWETVDRVLRRRYPDAFRELAAALEEADPLEVVYPDNPGEYDDVVLELLVLLAGSHGSVAGRTVDEVVLILEEGLRRRFGEEPDGERLRHAAELLIGGAGPKS